MAGIPSRFFENPCTIAMPSEIHISYFQISQLEIIIYPISFKSSALGTYFARKIEIEHKRKEPSILDRKLEDISMIKEGHI